MTRKALLIGAETGGLTGVRNDVAAMRRAIEPRGFEIAELTSPHATRAGILDAYDQLVAQADHDDAIVVYYSGHGGLLIPPDGAGADDEERPELQFIVPDDYADSTDGDFRGITSYELSVALAKLTGVTPNVTVVLDCCHSAHMSRNAGLRVKSLLRRAAHRTTYQEVREHLRSVRQSLDHRDAESNPHAVRVVACAARESAWEGTNRDGVRMGLFTDALSRAILDAEGLPVTWSTLLDAVRRDVRDFNPAQRPDVEGPSARPLFESGNAEALGALPVVEDGHGRVRLLGAPLLDVQVGDEFTVRVADRPLGTATVDGLGPAVALAELRPAPDSLPKNAQAHRLRAAAPALAVRVPEEQPGAAEVLTAMALRPLVRRAGWDEDKPVEVDVHDARRLVNRADIRPLHSPYPATALGADRIAAGLQRLAQAAALRRLDADPAASLEHDVVVEWGRIRVRDGESTKDSTEDSTEELLPSAGALVYAHPGERIFIRLRNRGDEVRYVSLVDIGVSSRIALLCGADQGGVRLVPGAVYTYGWSSDRGKGKLAGVQVRWPEAVDATYARPETVLVLVSDDTVDVSVRQLVGVRDAAHLYRRLTEGAGVERLLTQISTGATREASRSLERKVRYAVERSDFMVSPTAPPRTEEAPFLLDDRPEPPVRLLSPRGTLPGRVAVRINTMTVHRNRALMSADVRLDAVVISGGGKPQTTTIRFGGIRDGEALPLENVIIYHGRAVDFLDIAVWVSRDRGGSLARGELLEDKLSDPTFQAAGTQETNQNHTTPHTTTTGAVAGATAVVVNTAYRLLSGAVGTSIGLYRTSLLAEEQFGIGRHERHPQDFSFTYSVEPVG